MMSESLEAKLCSLGSLWHGRADDAHSLMPDRAMATDPSILLRQLLADHSVANRLSIAVVDGVSAVLASTMENFPDNIFWDFDYLIGFLLRLERSQKIHATVALIQDLNRAFGRFGRIRFRYAHDFLYGFDWERWVAKDPEARQTTTPFDLNFLKYLWQRHLQILRAIRDDDREFPPLEPGMFRNPFGFARTPEAERHLHTKLAIDGFVPLKAWDPGATPDWRQEASRRRDQMATRDAS